MTNIPSSNYWQRVVAQSSTTPTLPGDVSGTPSATDTPTAQSGVPASTYNPTPKAKGKKKPKPTVTPTNTTTKSVKPSSTPSVSDEPLPTEEPITSPSEDAWSTINTSGTIGTGGTDGTDNKKINRKAIDNVVQLYWDWINVKLDSTKTKEEEAAAKKAYEDAFKKLTEEEQKIATAEIENEEADVGNEYPPDERGKGDK